MMCSGLLFFTQHALGVINLKAILCLDTAALKNLLKSPKCPQTGETAPSEAAHKTNL